VAKTLSLSLRRFRPKTYKGRPVEDWLSKYRPEWDGEHPRLFELSVIDKVGKSEWDKMDYWDKVERLAAAVVENQKLTVLEVERKERELAAQRKK